MLRTSYLTLLNRYVKQLLPASLLERLLGYQYDTPNPCLIPVHCTARIPDPVTSTATIAELRALYPWSRRHLYPQSVKVLEAAH